MYKPMATYNKDRGGGVVFNLIAGAAIATFILTFISWWAI